MKKSFVLVFGLMLCVSPMSFSQYIFEDAPLGDFTNQASYGNDWADPEYNSYADGAYEVLGSGSDIWDAADNFFFVYKEVEGSFIMTADVAWGDQEIPGGGPVDGNEWKKMGLMAREDAESNGSRHAFALLRRDLLGVLDYRAEADAASLDVSQIAKAAGQTDTIQLVRSGDTFSMFRGTETGEFVSLGSTTIVDMADTLFVGLAVTAHDTANLERAFFSNVTIEAISVGATITRKTDNIAIDIGDSVAVEVAVEIEKGKTADVTVKEVVPEGWPLSNLSVSPGAAELVGNVITWSIPGATGAEAKMTYDLASPAGFIGAGAFVGSVDTGSDVFPTGGPISVSTIPPAGSDLGLFDAHEDIFDTEENLGVEGDARYDAVSGTYVVMGSGRDIWDAADSCHFLYKEVSADEDAYLKANVVLENGSSSSTWAKAGLMVRDELWTDAAMGFAMIRSDGRDYSPQWRNENGAAAAWGEDATLVYGGTDEGQQNGVIEIAKVGDSVIFSYYDASTGEKVEALNTQDIILGNADNKYLIGCVVTAHEAGSVSIGTFTDVQLTIGAPPVAVSEWSLF